jgi:hypothetical protein
MPFQHSIENIDGAIASINDYTAEYPHAIEGDYDFTTDEGYDAYLKAQQPAIPFQNQDTRDYYRINILIKHNSGNSTSRYEIGLDKNQNCCEVCSWVIRDTSIQGSYNSTKFDRNIYFEDLENILKNSIGKQISKIEIIERPTLTTISDSSKHCNSFDVIITYSTADGNSQKLIIQLCNVHNGYYPRKMYVKLFENNDSDGMCIIHTRI